MEQYELLPGTWYKSLRYALKYFRTDRILLRTTGSAESAQGVVIVGERLDDKWLDLTMVEGGLLVGINGQRRGLYIVDRSQHFRRDKPLDGRTWSLAYERVIGDTTMFRSVNMGQYIEIVFEGKISILPTKKKVIKNFPGLYPEWYYWQVDKTKTTK